MSVTNFNAAAQNPYEYDPSVEEEPSGFEFQIGDPHYGIATYSARLHVRQNSDFVTIEQNGARISLHVGSIEGLVALLPKIRKLQKAK